MSLKCRFCENELRDVFVDLGVLPISNAYLDADQTKRMEPFYPLHTFVCSRCFLVQSEGFVTPENLFQEYAYFSSYSDSWLEHAQVYTETIIEKLDLTGKSFVIEIASNDGYLLKNFIARHIPVLGIEPAANIAPVAMEKGIPTLIRFFGTDLAKELRTEGKIPDLIIGNNVLAHVPNLNDFVAGMKILLAPLGVITMEFPHLLKLMAENQFDTIYHEHFSYFSFLTAEKVFNAHGLQMFDVEELPTHGGSLRIYAAHRDNSSRKANNRVAWMVEKEMLAGMDRIETYRAFHKKVEETKRDVLSFLIQAKNEGKSIVGYGAPAKGNTLLNYCGIRRDFFDYTVDRNPYKQGHFLPGTHIPIEAPEKIQDTRPDYVFILPWNLKDEIMKQMAYVRDWGGRFVIPIPHLQVI